MLDALFYQWYCVELDSVLLEWTPVTSAGDCTLSLSGIALARQDYTLVLQVTDGFVVEPVTDDMTLRVLNTPSAANAGPDRTETSENVKYTVITGTAADFDGGDVIEYRWLEGNTVLMDWTSSNASGECPLNLGTVPIAINAYPTDVDTFTLQVRDGYDVSSDDMDFTITNSSPHANFLQCAGTYPLGDDVILQGSVSDFDGDTLSYELKKGAQTLCTGIVTPPFGGAPVQLPDCVVSGLWLGSHFITLQVDEIFNESVVTDPPCEVVIIDTDAPVLAPSVTPGILWPPNHKMVNVVIEANASDNSGLPVNLGAVVTSNEPVDGLGDGDTAPDWSDPVIDQDTGVITLQLRAERSGTGDGRVYTITITATDEAGNSSSADVAVIVPHDKGKK
ncbi:MAG: hypothetical protein HY788_17655 [Deltaproteobacteria bacterium]|nr:hypothetical protein [Deltaproteobacteria bacterium]